jgi:hypothetical protein
MNNKYIRCFATSAVDNVGDTFDYVFGWGPDTWHHWAKACIFLKEDPGGKVVDMLTMPCMDTDALYCLDDTDMLTDTQLETIRDDKPAMFDKDKMDGLRECTYARSLKVVRNKGRLLTYLVVGDEPGCQVEALIYVESAQED